METNTTKTSVELSGEDIMRLLPHRDEALYLFNSIYIWPEEKKGTTSLLVTPELCVGHFPRNPIMPGHKLVEAVTQLLGVVAQVCYSEWVGGGMVLVWDRVKFRQPARSGNLLTLVVNIDKQGCRQKKWYVFGSGQVTNGQNMAVVTIGKIGIASIGLAE